MRVSVTGKTDLYNIGDTLLGLILISSYFRKKSGSVANSRASIEMIEFCMAPSSGTQNKFSDITQWITITFCLLYDLSTWDLLEILVDIFSVPILWKRSAILIQLRELGTNFPVILRRPWCQSIFSTVGNFTVE